MSNDRVDGRLRFVQSLQLRGDAISAEKLNQRLDNTPIGIVIGIASAETLAAQITALSAVNLLARLFRSFIISVPANTVVHERLPFLAGELGPALVHFAGRVHPNVRAELMEGLPNAAVTLHVADPLAPTDPYRIHCTGAGWLARVARQPVSLPSPSDGNPIGSLIAAVLGAAEIFKLVMGDTLPTVVPADDVTFSALTYSIGQIDPEPPLGNIQVPDTTLIGAGSIGSGFLWGLAHVREAQGNLVVVDHDRLEAHNPDRAILVLDGDAVLKPEKAVWAHTMIQSSLLNLTVRAYPGTIQAYVDSLPPDYVLPLVISAVDSIESRRDIQDALPGHILNASTGSTTVTISRHEAFGTSPCLYCLYLPELLERSFIHIAMERTGFPQRAVADLMMPGGVQMLTPGNVRGIERHNHLPAGTLRHYVGRRLSELLQDERMYAQVPIQIDSGQVLVTTSFVSALAGFLLLAEVVKEADPALAQYRLGGVYEQELLGVPNAFVYPSVRDKSGYCLCNDPFRRRLYQKKYDPIAGL